MGSPSLLGAFLPWRASWPTGKPAPDCVSIAQENHQSTDIRKAPPRQFLLPALPLNSQYGARVIEHHAVSWKQADVHHFTGCTCLLVKTKDFVEGSLRSKQCLNRYASLYCWIYIFNTSRLKTLLKDPWGWNNALIMLHHIILASASLCFYTMYWMRFSCIWLYSNGQQSNIYMRTLKLNQNTIQSKENGVSYTSRL